VVDALGRAQSTAQHNRSGPGPAVVSGANAFRQAAVEGAGLVGSTGSQTVGSHPPGDAPKGSPSPGFRVRAAHAMARPIALAIAVQLLSPQSGVPGGQAGVPLLPFFFASSAFFFFSSSAAFFFAASASAAFFAAASFSFLSLSACFFSCSAFAICFLSAFSAARSRAIVPSSFPLSLSTSVPARAAFSAASR
jgi:hypothetical protein